MTISRLLDTTSRRTGREPLGSSGSHQANTPVERLVWRSVARIEVLLFPVASLMRPLDPTPSLQPHYEPSSLLGVGPPQCSVSVPLASRFSPLGLLPSHQSDWF